MNKIINILYINVFVFCFASCAPTLGPKVYADGQNSLNRRIATTYDKQVLRNLIRYQNGLFPYHVKYGKITGKGTSQVTVGNNILEDSITVANGGNLLTLTDRPDKDINIGYQLNDDFGGEAEIISGENAAKILSVYRDHSSINVIGPELVPNPNMPISVWIRIPELGKIGYFSIEEKHKKDFLLLQSKVYLPGLDLDDDFNNITKKCKKPQEKVLPIPVKIVQ